MKKENKQNPKLDKEEKGLLQSYEKDEWESTLPYRYVDNGNRMFDNASRGVDNGRPGVSTKLSCYINNAICKHAKAN
jgi:hypothetical protein